MAIPEGSGEWIYALTAWTGDCLCSYLGTHLRGHMNLLDCSCYEHPREHTGLSLPRAHLCQGSTWHRLSGKAPREESCDQQVPRQEGQTHLLCAPEGIAMGAGGCLGTDS